MYKSSFPSPEARAAADASSWAAHEERIKKEEALKIQRREMAMRNAATPVRSASHQRAQALLEKYKRGEQLNMGEEYFLRKGVEYDATDNASGYRASRRPDLTASGWPGVEYLNLLRGTRTFGGGSPTVGSPTPPVDVASWAASADANQLPEEMRQFFLDEVTNAKATQNWDKVGNWMQGWKAATGQEPIRQQDRAQERAAEVVMHGLTKPEPARPYGMPDMSGAVTNYSGFGGGHGVFSSVPKRNIELAKQKAELEWLEMEMKKREMQRRMEEMSNPFSGRGRDIAAQADAEGQRVRDLIRRGFVF